MQGSLARQPWKNTVVKILLIEDDQAAASLFNSLVLAPLGAEVVIVDSISAANGMMADVALLDLRIRPDFNSQSTLANMHSLKPPIVVLTNDPTEGLEEKAIQAGARGFFRKIDVIENPVILREAILSIAS